MDEIVSKVYISYFTTNGLFSYDKIIAYVLNHEDELLGKAGRFIKKYAKNKKV